MTCGWVVSWNMPPSSCGVELAPEDVDTSGGGVYGLSDWKRCIMDSGVIARLLDR